MLGHLFLPLGLILVEYAAKEYTTGFLVMLSVISSLLFRFKHFHSLRLRSQREYNGPKITKVFLARSSSTVPRQHKKAFNKYLTHEHTIF